MAFSGTKDVLATDGMIYAIAPRDASIVAVPFAGPDGLGFTGAAVTLLAPVTIG